MGRIDKQEEESRRDNDHVKEQEDGAEANGDRCKFYINGQGGVVLNDDNDESRRAVELCYRTRKTLVNPIIDWDESDVWEFLNEIVKVPHCCLYDEGFKRLGCIGCPMGTTERRIQEFERWPTYKRAYIRAFDKMIQNRIEGGGTLELTTEQEQASIRHGSAFNEWRTGNDVMWYLLSKG